MTHDEVLFDKRTNGETDIVKRVKLLGDTLRAIEKESPLLRNEGDNDATFDKAVSY